MKILEIRTNQYFDAEVSPVEFSDFKSITKARYYFNWKEEQKNEIFKLTIFGTEDILGLISIERYPEEWRIHIRLLTVSIENKGNGKRFDNIAGNLIAHVAKLAVKEFGHLACISLRPKSILADFYIQKYQMKITGTTLSLEVPEIIELINQYS